MKVVTTQIPASGMTFSALEAGPKNGPLVLCLHGFPQFADAWTPHLLAFAKEGFRAVAVDQRGYAKDARPEDQDAYAIPNICDDIFRIADALGADRFHLVGHDWGGIVAWHVAYRNPERVISMSVLSVPHPKAFSRAISSSWDQRIRSSYVLLFRAPFHLAERVLKAQNWKALRAMYQGKISRDQENRNVARLGEDDGKTLTAALNWYRTYDFQDGASAGKISVPTLYIRGSADVALGKKGAELTAEYMTGDYEYVELEGYSHWLIDENPARVNELILSHLNVERETPADKGTHKEPAHRPRGQRKSREDEHTHGL